MGYGQCPCGGEIVMAWVQDTHPKAAPNPVLVCDRSLKKYDQCDLMEFPLWQFVIRRGDSDFGYTYFRVVTRGNTIDQAKEYMVAHHKGRITPETFCNIDAAEKYSENHADNWFHRPPKWLLPRLQLRTSALYTGDVNK